MKNLINLLGAGILVYLLFSKKENKPEIKKAVVTPLTATNTPTIAIGEPTPKQRVLGNKEKNNAASPLLSTYEATFEEKLLYLNGGA